MLYYVPLEPYEQRYTMQLSAEKTGWLEAAWRSINLPYTRIGGETYTEYDRAPGIKTGSVLDAVGRSVWSFNQIRTLLELAEKGTITSADTIYFDDFWTPGIEALPYLFAQLDIRPRMYAYCWAQSVDEFDFTYPWRHWIRHFEKGIGQLLDGIFCACPTHADLISFAGIGFSRARIHATGHPWSTNEVLSRMTHLMPEYPEKREDTVIFSSRWDKEKNPLFFLDVVGQVLKRLPFVKFKILTSQPHLKTNNSTYLAVLREALAVYPKNLLLLEGLTKQQYYAELCKARVIFNCANQDFISYGLLEASVAGCYPIYPYFRSFPEVLRHENRYLYPHLDLQAATDWICCAIGGPVDLWSQEAIRDRSWIHRRFDNSWKRMLVHMNLLPLFNEEPLWS